MNPPTIPLQVRYGIAASTHLKFATVNDRRVAFEVTDPAKAVPRGMTRDDMKRIKRGRRKQRIRELKTRNSTAL